MTKFVLDLDIDVKINTKFETNPVFEGEDGHYFLELQKLAGGDPRFKLDSRFVGDIDTKKLPKDMQEKFIRPETTTDTADEKSKMLKLLGEVVPSSNRYIDKSPAVPTHIQRFDPKNPNQNMIEKVKKLEENLEKTSKKVKLTDNKKGNQQHKKHVKSDLRKKAPRRKVAPEIKVNPTAFSKVSSAPFKLFG